LTATEGTPETKDPRAAATERTGVRSPDILSTDGLTKDFGGITAVDDVNFTVEEGELRCLIGPNGAGKSTLFKLLTGQHKPTEGYVYYDGEDITDLKPHERIERGMSMKFQVPSVFESLSVRENMRTAAQRVAEDVDARVDEELKRFGLLEKEDVPAQDLSHGETQVLEIAMATSLDPKLLLLDEPVAGMSVEETERVADMLNRLNDETKKTFVVIEHDIDFVEMISDRVTVLNQGSVFRQDSIDAIKNDPEVREIYLGSE
jgi:branched-chain amino acid transport system ATP-binding protein